MKKPKRAILLIFILSITLALSACNSQASIKTAAKTSLGALAGNQYTKIDKIVFSDGTRRNKDFTLTDKQKIAEFLNDYINKITVKEIKNFPLSVGWARGAAMFAGNNLVLDFDFIGPFSYNNKNYKIVKGSFTPNQIDKFIISVNSEWKKYTRH